MKFSSYISVVALMAASLLVGCQDDYEKVENRVMDTNSRSVASVLIDGMTSEQTVRFNVTMVEPMETPVDVVYEADFSLVEAYNTIYNGSAVALPAENCELVQPVATFEPQLVKSTDVAVRIFDLDLLDRNLVYCLPLTVKSSPVPVLESQKTRFIVVRGAALVNVAANMVKNYGEYVNPGSTSDLNDLSEMTFQCILNVDEWGGSDSNIQSIAGIEGQWLLRIADSGVPQDQLQFVTPSGNVTSSSWQLTAKKWLRFTFTYNASAREATLFLDGVKKDVLATPTNRALSWGGGSFYIGKSWNNNRWLNGAICEVRIWNRILSDAEIAGANQAYIIPNDSEGLVCYWKFNEGEGNLIRDYANGHDLILAEQPTWLSISLPE